MIIATMSRSAVGGTIKLVRAPFDLAVKLLPGNGSGARPSAQFAIDRCEALARDVAGTVLRDGELRDDAARRRSAADERARALRLRDAATDTAEQAQTEFKEQRAQSDEQRKRAAAKAAKRRAAARSSSQARTRQAGETAAERKAATRRVKAAHQQAIEEDADEARLEQLRAEAAALEEQENALVAEAEAQRLQDEASRKKAARKGS